MKQISRTSFLLLLWSSAFAGQSIRHETPSDAAGVFTGLGGGWLRLAEARKLLASHPPADVARMAALALNDSDAFATGQRRADAYDLLISVVDAEPTLVCDQLLKCVSEPDFRNRCASWLWRCQETHSDNIVSSLGPLLQEDRANVSGAILRALGKCGTDAREYLPDVEARFSDRTQTSEIRHAAAFAMTRIGGIARAMPLFLADPALDESYWPMAALGWSSEVRYNPTREERRMIQDYVTEAVRSESLSVRKRGFEALAPAFTPDFLVVTRDGKFAANPQFVKAVRFLATKETDQRLRSRAQSVLDTLDQRVQKAERKRTTQSRP